MGYGHSDNRKASVRFSSSKTNGFMSQGVREERLVTRVTGFRLHMTSRISHCMYLHFFWVCNNLRLQSICTKIGSLNKCRLVVFVFPHSLCDSNELWHFHLNLNLGCVCVYVCCSVASVMSESLRPYGQQTARLLCPQDFTGNTRMGCCAFLQGIFLTQGSNLLLLQADFLPTEPAGKPRS